MNQAFKRLLNNKFVRNYSSYSISNEQILTKENNKRSGSRLGKFIAFVVVSKLGYDSANTTMAYLKGKNATTESIVDQTWNEILYPVFQVVTRDPTVVNALTSGGNNGQVTLSKPPSQAKTPIIELERNFNFKLAPIDLSAESFHDNQWFLQKVGVGSDPKKPIDLEKLTATEKKHFDLGILDTIYQELREHKVGDQISMIPNQYLPLLVPNKNKIFPLIYGESTSDIIIPIEGSKGTANILFNLYASDDKWQVRNVEVIFENDSIKKKQFIKSN